jgi:hypothetical protein
VEELEHARFRSAPLALRDLRPAKAIEPSDTGQITKASVDWLRAGRIMTTLLVVASSVLSAAPAWTADDTEQVVLAAHQRRRAATLAGEVAALDSMMTDDLTFMHANAAVETKAELLDALKTGRYKYQSLTGCASMATLGSSPGRVAFW